MTIDYKDKFMTIYGDNIKREGSDKLLSHLSKSDFFVAPASTRFHESYEGGLVEHSVKVYEKLKQIAPSGKWSEETLAICGLLHDVCKIGFYAVEMRNKKIDGKWMQVPAYTIDDKFPFGHGEKSVYLINSLMTLTDEEAVAIRFHMGAYDNHDILNTLGLAYEKYPLAFYLHSADVMASHNIE